MAKERKKITPKKNIDIDKQEKVLQALHQKDSSAKSKKVQRVTVDFPLDVYEEMKELTEEKGHTLKWYIVNLVKKHLKEKE